MYGEIKNYTFRNIETQMKFVFKAEARRIEEQNHRELWFYLESRTKNSEALINDDDTSFIPRSIIMGQCRVTYPAEINVQQEWR